MIIQHVGFVLRQSVERCSSGWRASWVGGQVWGRGCRSSRQSQWSWSNSTSHKSSNSWLPGWAVSEAILPALLFALALGDCSVESNWQAMTLSAGWHTAVFSLKQEEMELRQTAEDIMTVRLSICIPGQDMLWYVCVCYILLICHRKGHLCHSFFLRNLQPFLFEQAGDSGQLHVCVVKQQIVDCSNMLKTNFKVYCILYINIDI